MAQQYDKNQKQSSNMGQQQNQSGSTQKDTTQTGVDTERRDRDNVGNTNKGKINQ